MQKCILKCQTELMRNNLKATAIKLLVYMVIGFGIAFIWHKMKNS